MSGIYSTPPIEQNYNFFNFTGRSRAISGTNRAQYTGGIGPVNYAGETTSNTLGINTNLTRGDVVSMTTNDGQYHPARILGYA